MMIDGMREDFWTGDQAKMDFGYEGFKSTFVEDVLAKYPKNSRYYSVHTSAPTYTFQGLRGMFTGRNPSEITIINNAHSTPYTIVYDSVFRHLYEQSGKIDAIGGK